MLPAQDAPEPDARSRKRELRDERLAFFDGARAHTDHVSVQVKDLTFFVSTADLAVSRSLFVKRARGDRAVMQTAIDVLTENGMPPREDGLFVDVGANIGTATLVALTEHGFGRALAIEPAVANYRLLRANVVVNGLESRVATLQVALADAPGRRKLVLNESNWGDHRLARTDAPESGVEDDDIVDVATLDQLVAKGIVPPEETSLVWIDAQGAEPAILSSAGDLLSHGVPVVFELWPASYRDDDVEQLVGALESAYAFVVDLRQRGGETALPKAEPIERLRGLVEHYTGTGRFSDVLVFGTRAGS